MGHGSYFRTSFLGGEWSKYAQGRADKEEYVTALDKCFNAIPVEEGAVTRRPGTMQCSPTRNGVAGVLRAFDFTESVPYVMEFTPGFLRFHSGLATISENEQTISTIAADTTYPYASALVATVNVHGLNVGDQVVCRQIGTLSGAFGLIAPLLGRQFRVVAVPTTHEMVLVDSILGDFNAASVTLGTNTIGISKVVEFAVPYQADDLDNIRIVQDGTDAFILCAGFQPKIVTQLTAPVVDTTGDPTKFATFSVADAVFLDGPYLDPPTDGTTVTSSGLGPGAVTLTFSSITAINGGTGFVAGDVGRAVRMFSEPALWAVGTAYAIGASVKYEGSYWTALVATTGSQPGLDLTIWAINPTGAQWVWGTITAVTSTLIVNVNLAAASVDTAGNALAGGAMLYANAVTDWQLGIYGNGIWPSCGTFHESRVYLAGAIDNHFDASVSNQPFQFYPTDLYGTVADDMGISETLEAPEVEPIFWMIPGNDGIVMGTQAGEWTLQASSFGDPITPTSIQSHKVTQFGSANVEPRRTGLSMIFVRRFGRKLTEYISDVYSHRYTGSNLSQNSAHLMTSGIAEIAYIKETTPVVWSRMNDGTIASMTYRRDSPFGTQPASFFGWAPHALGNSRSVLSLQGGPSVGGDKDALSLLTQDPTTGLCFVELMSDIFLETDLIQSARFVDGGANVTGMDLVTISGIQYYQFYGLYYDVGNTISVFLAGIDLGDYVVLAGGNILVPTSATDPYFTEAYIATLVGLDPPKFLAPFTIPAPNVYKMFAEENYDTATAALIADGHSLSLINTDPGMVGTSYDYSRRKIIYLAFLGNPVLNIGTGDYEETNTTGFTLWDGTNSIAPGGTYSIESNLRGVQIAEKDIDTGEVKFYPVWNILNTVPAAIAGDGTWRRIMTDALPTSGNSPVIVNPRNSDVFVHVQSCELYQFRKEDNFAQVVSPIPPSGTDHTANVYPLGVDETWVYSLQTPDGSSVPSDLFVTPSAITSDEFAADAKLKYATYSPPAVDGLRSTFGNDGDLYFFGVTVTTTTNFTLNKFVPPAYAAFGLVSGGGFTDITPWTTDGPNADGAAYANSFVSNPSPASMISLFRLPAVNQAVALEKFLSGNKSFNDFDFADTVFSCTYCQLGVSPTFDHHTGFVTGYMSSAWAPTTLADAQWAVSDYREMDTYLDQSDYIYPGIDYSLRWLVFDCFPVTGGVVDAETTKLHTIMVQYKFVYGADPIVVQVLDEGNWDTLYTEYAGKIATISFNQATNSNVIFNSLPIKQGNSGDLGFSSYIYDTGFSDIRNSGVTFWFSGATTWIPERFVNDPGANLFYLNPALTPRSQYFLNQAVNVSTPAPMNPPFLKIVYQPVYTLDISISLGHTYESRVRLTRPVHAQETFTPQGPALGKTRRTHQLSALLVNTQGISFGVDLSTQYPAQFTSPGGNPYQPYELWSGVYWTTLEADYSYDNMLSWSVTRPYPATVAAMEGHLATAER